MLLIYFMLLKVQSYNIYLIGLRNEYDQLINSKTNQVDSHIHLKFIDCFENLQSLSSDSIDGIIGYTEDALEQSKFELFANSYEIPFLSISAGFSDKFTYFTDYPTKCFSESVISLVNHFELLRPSVIWAYSNQNMNTIENLNLNSNFHFSHYSFTKNLTIKEISRALSSSLKQDGIQNFFFLPDNELCGNLIKGFQESFLEKKGNIAILFTDCLYHTQVDGFIYLTYESFEDAETFEIYKNLKYLKFLNAFSEGKVSKESISRKLKKIYNNNCGFSIINIQGGNRKKVGVIYANKVIINETLTYIGGIHNLSNYKTPKIVLSANTGSFNPNGFPRVYSNEGYHQGTYFAVDKINRDLNYFPKYKLELYDKVDCGVSVFDYNYSKECFFKHRSEMGISYIPTFFPVTLSALKQLQYYDLSIPFIGGIGSSGLLSNKSEYPYFVRTVSPSTDFAVAWANLIRLYGWNKIVVHYSNDGFAGSAYKVLNSSQEAYGFSFINAEKYRMVEYILSYESIFSYYEHIKHSISLGCNIIFLILGDPAAYFWLEGFYDMGARRGDFTFVLFANNGLSNFQAANANVDKRKELMHGTFVIYNGAWVGEYGTEVKKEYLNYWKDHWGRSHFIDAVYAAAETTNFLIKQGEVFENEKIFMQALRNIRFLGTTGTISFDSESNNRNINYFNVFNFFEDDFGNWHDDAIALISPLGTVYYTVLQDIVWAGGRQPLSMKENYQNCPFRREEIKKSNSADKIKIGVSVAILLISCTLSLYSLKRMKAKKIVMLTKKVYIELQDYLTFSFIFIEAIQMISIGPSFESFNLAFSDISQALSFNISKLTQLKDTKFWIVFFATIFLSYSWIFLLIICYIKLSSRFINRLNEIKTLSIPIMTNYLFLPIIICLLSILMCDKAIGDHYYDSFLNYDCSTFCWKYSHIGYSILACFQIIIYVPVAILYRTIWQEESDSLNIHTNSKFLIIKNISVVILVIISKILKDDFPLAHGLIFFGIVLFLLILIILIKHPFNYDRANLWCKIMIFCVIWNTFTCLIGNHLIKKNYAIVVLQVVGWVFIIGFGILMQRKLPENLIVSIKGRSVVDLFRFAFGIESYRNTIYFINTNKKLSEIEKSGA